MRLFLLLLLFSVHLYSQDLPKGLTPEEKILMQNYNSPLSEGTITANPASPVRTMAEWEPLDGIVITWISYQAILRQIVQHAQKEGTVYIVCSDSITVKNYLTSGGVPHTNLKFVITGFNSIWIRDYGPWSVYTNDADSLLFIDWTYNRPRPLDDIIPVTLGNYLGVPVYQNTIEPDKLTNTGGNFMTDGLGKGFASKLVLQENTNKTEAQINSIVSRYMGIDNYIKMETLPYDGIHHIDMHMKLLDEETLLVGQYPAGISDGPQIEANLAYVLNNFQSAYGRPYRVIRIPMPPDAQGRWPSNGGHYRTFTNSTFVNKTVIVPTYALQYDTTALRIYREAMPGYTIAGIDCNQIIPASGAIHCINKEIGLKNTIFISHKPLRDFNIPLDIEGFRISAYIKSNSAISNPVLKWSIDTANGFNSVAMSMFTPDSFYAHIPSQSYGTKVHYYIEAQNSSGLTVSKPLVAPGGNYQFFADNPLPVELTSFTISTSGNDVLLEWATASELNNSGFEIQRRVSGKDDLWQNIGFVEGKGSFTGVSRYTFTDTPLKGNSYQYRLKQIDFDGTSSYSQIEEIYLTVSEYALYQNYPNPFSGEFDQTIIGFSVESEGYISLKLYNSAGEEIINLREGNIDAGYHQVKLSSAILSSGIYFYRINFTPVNGGASFNSAKKLIVTK